jgi:hypothetical protein
MPNNCKNLNSPYSSLPSTFNGVSTCSGVPLLAFPSAVDVHSATGVSKISGVSAASDVSSVVGVHSLTPTVLLRVRTTGLTQKIDKKYAKQSVQTGLYPIC